MPVLKHAKKKLRQDKKRTLDNLKIKNTYKKLLKAAKTKKTAESVSAAFSAIDKAAKKGIIHDNKAARLKASLSKTTTQDKAPVKEEKAVAKSAKKPAVKKKASPKKK